MEEGIRKNKGVPRQALGSRSESTSRLMYERRPLKTVTLTPPDYKVLPHILRDSYLEKEVTYAGVVPNIPVHLDATNRTDVLRVIDRGKREECVRWVTNYEHDAIFCLTAQNIKISRRDGNEDLLLRLPIHEVAAICYIKDDDHHILGIKFGNLELGPGLTLTEDTQDVCQLAVLNCDSRGSAEELCSLIGQCFQLVYTEATMQFLDTRLSEVAAGLSIGSSTLKSDKSSSSTPKHERSKLGFLTQSSLELSLNGGTTVSSRGSRSLPRTVANTRRNSVTRSESELSAAANEMIQDYMKKLYTRLNTDELRRFAKLVMAWHTNMSFSDFCEHVFELYGPERKHLLIGMQPFIPEKDTEYFDTFLEKLGLCSAGTWGDTTSSAMSHVNRRTYSGTSYSAMTGTGDEYDARLNEISHNIENLATSVDLDMQPDSITHDT